MQKPELRPIGARVCIDYPPEFLSQTGGQAIRWHYVVTEHVQQPGCWMERIVPTHRESIPLAQARCRRILTYAMSDVFDLPQGANDGPPTKTS